MSNQYTWDLSVFYASFSDPQIEKDLVALQGLSSLRKNTGSFWLKQPPRQPDGLCLLPCPWLYTGDPSPGGWDDHGKTEYIHTEKGGSKELDVMLKQTHRT